MDSADAFRQFLELDPTEPPNLYGLVDRLRHVADSLFQREHISDIYFIIYGFRLAMVMHNIPGNLYEDSFDMFQDWLEKTIGSINVSWCEKLLNIYGSEQQAFQAFFRFLEEYRNLPEFRV